jgi:hypothetical protein
VTFFAIASQRGQTGETSVAVQKSSLGLTKICDVMPDSDRSCDI